MIKLKYLKYYIGPYFYRNKYGGWYFRLGFYWFSILFFKRWDPDLRHGDGHGCPSTGFILDYITNSIPKEGDMIYIKRKKWMWPDYPK